MRHIPNILSSLRIVMAAVFVPLFFRNKYWLCIAVYMAAFFTDLVDGYLARRNGWISDVGKVLDPLADKLMLIAALVCFYIQQWIPGYMFWLAAAKEAIMILGGILLYHRSVVVYADWFGKFASGFFTAGVLATLLKNYHPWIGMGNLVLIGIAIMLAIIALVHYTKKQVFSR